MLCCVQKDKEINPWIVAVGGVSGDLGRPEIYRRTEVEVQILIAPSSFAVRVLQQSDQLWRDPSWPLSPGGHSPSPPTSPKPLGHHPTLPSMHRPSLQQQQQGQARVFGVALLAVPWATTIPRNGCKYALSHLFNLVFFSFRFCIIHTWISQLLLGSHSGSWIPIKP